MHIVLQLLRHTIGNIAIDRLSCERDKRDDPMFLNCLDELDCVRRDSNRIYAIIVNECFLSILTDTFQLYYSISIELQQGDYFPNTIALSPWPRMLLSIITQQNQFCICTFFQKRSKSMFPLIVFGQHKYLLASCKLILIVYNILDDLFML